MNVSTPVIILIIVASILVIWLSVVSVMYFRLRRERDEVGRKAAQHGGGIPIAGGALPMAEPMRTVPKSKDGGPRNPVDLFN